jgi:hypothetical protein
MLIRGIGKSSQIQNRALKQRLEPIDENGGRPGVRLRKSAKQKPRIDARNDAAISGRRQNGSGLKSCCVVRRSNDWQDYHEDE